MIQKYLIMGSLLLSTLVGAIQTTHAANEIPSWQSQSFHPQLIHPLDLAYPDRVAPFFDDTPYVPITILDEGFETDSGWVLVNGGTEGWVIGNAVSSLGNQSLYVSGDGGLTHSVVGSGMNVSFAYKDLDLTESQEVLTLSFDWICMGMSVPEDFNGFLRVWIIDQAYTPVADLPIEMNAGNNYILQLGRTFYFDNMTFLQEEIRIDPVVFPSADMRLVFEWLNFGSALNPPAAIDNVFLGLPSCPPVEQLLTEVLGQGDRVLLSWEPIGAETQWEVLVMELDDPTVIDDNSVGILVQDPEYIYEIESGSDAETFYKFYVRPVCSEDEKGRWSPQGVISLVNPPGCAQIEAGFDAEGLDFSINEEGTYVTCQEEPITVNLTASYQSIPSTTSYNVEAINYDPPFPFIAGIEMSLRSDDQYSASFDLPFEFCFFGETYQYCNIGDNGLITFGMDYSRMSGAYCDYIINGEIPNPDFNIKNSIYGVYQDLLTLNNPGANTKISYQVLGSYPCRTLVVNFNEVPTFKCSQEEYRATTQIVLYEITNIIEIYVKKRKACVDYEEGRGLLGIQNADGTLAYAPPGRNTGNWSAEEEAWRFSPSGPVSETFYWEKDGEFYSNDLNIEVSISESTTYTAKIDYETCSGIQSLQKDVRFLKDDLEIQAVQDLFDCARPVGELNVFELRNNDALVLGDLDPEAYTIAYYRSAADAENQVDPLPDVYEVTERQSVYVRLTNSTTLCFQVADFELVVEKPLNIADIEDLQVCNSFVFPNLKKGESFFSEALGQGTRYAPGDVIEQLGIYTFYVYKELQSGCYAESSFQVEIVGTPKAMVVEDQRLSCETFFLPPVEENNEYYTQPNGEGMPLPVGYEVRQPMTVYIYVATEGDDGKVCVDESQFTVSFDDCPLPKGISPNGDDLNDTFDLTGYGILDIKIYNRFGVEVFAYDHTYTNQWFGQDKSGNPLPDGTYYYVLNANGKPRTGWVQINR